MLGSYIAPVGQAVLHRSAQAFQESPPPPDSFNSAGEAPQNNNIINLSATPPFLTRRM